MKDSHVVGDNETQRNIFRSIFNRGRTKEEIARSLDVAEKTVSNNIPKLRAIVDADDRYHFIQNFDEFQQRLYSIVERRQIEVVIPPKIFTWARSTETTQYMVVNLPEPPKGYDHWVVIPLGDLHYGSDACDTKVLNDYIEWIKNTPNVLVQLQGDLIENSNKESPGDSVFRQVMPPQEQKERLIKLLAPIADRIMFSVMGNHGYRSVKGCYLDPERDISHALGCEYFTGFACVDIVCQTHRWEFFAMHGRGNSATPEGRIKQVRRKSEFHSAHVYTMGHVHDLQELYDYELIRNPRTLKLERKKRYYVITGTTQGYFNSYAAEWSLQPNKVGFAKINLYCDGSKEPGDYDVDLKW